MFGSVLNCAGAGLDSVRPGKEQPKSTTWEVMSQPIFIAYSGMEDFPDFARQSGSSPCSEHGHSVGTLGIQVD